MSPHLSRLTSNIPHLRPSLYLAWCIFTTLFFTNNIPLHAIQTRGHWDVSTGLHIWQDHSYLRNLQFRSLVYFPKNWRLNTVLRSNHDVFHISKIQPKIDEGYLQWQQTKPKNSGYSSWSVKIGEMRYLRFPEPDIISMFDQVPGIEDLSKGKQTSYRGIMINHESTLIKNYGLHNSILQWANSDQKGISILESYLFYRYHGSLIDIEYRLGQLAERKFPLGQGSMGYSGYMGLTYKGFKAGILYEYLQTEGIRTGILVEFNKNPVNKILGQLRTDYTRSPEGFGIQPTLLKGHFGMTKTVPQDRKKVGEIITQQTITYWQNGQGRNFYEHIISQTGTTKGDNLIIVMKEYPKYLKVESLVSQHNSFQNWDDLVKWERKRQGPAELSKRVVYEFYE